MTVDAEREWTRIRAAAADARERMKSKPAVELFAAAAKSAVNEKNLLDVEVSRFLEAAAERQLDE